MKGVRWRTWARGREELRDFAVASHSFGLSFLFVLLCVSHLL